MPGSATLEVPESSILVDTVTLGFLGLRAEILTDPQSSCLCVVSEQRAVESKEEAQAGWAHVLRGPVPVSHDFNLYFLFYFF